MQNGSPAIESLRDKLSRIQIKERTKAERLYEELDRAGRSIEKTISRLPGGKVIFQFEKPLQKRRKTRRVIVWTREGLFYQGRKLDPHKDEALLEEINEMPVKMIVYHFIL